jgi:superfamily II DNA or RNA helicase
MSGIMELKPHQIAAKTAILEKLDQGVGTQLAVLPTGTGKTFLASSVSEGFERTLFIAHRDELISQTVKTVQRVSPDRQIGYVVQGQHEIEAPFVVGMVQTLANRLPQIPPDWFDLIVIDEAHHACAKTYRTVAEHFKPRLLLGLSATPERSDGADLSHLFSEISFQMTLPEAIDGGYLVKPIAMQLLTSCSLEGVRSSAGDLNERDLSVAVDIPQRNEFIVQKFIEHATSRKAIAFTVDLEHARNLVAAFNSSGIKAESVAGDDPDRADKLARFAAGDFQLLASCMVLSEGYDCPSVDCVLMCRPTKSKSLYCQQIGRGLRLCDGKTDCLILDFVDVASRHSLVTAWRFFGYAPPANQYAEGKGDGSRKRVSRVQGIDLERQIDLLKPPPVINQFDYGSRDWHFAPATEPQLTALAYLGYDTIRNTFTKGQACALIAGQPATKKQLRKLADCGYDISAEWTRAQADKALTDSLDSMTAMIKRIKARGFTIEVIGSRLKVNPVDQLNDNQCDWISRNYKPLVYAIKQTQSLN